MEYNDIYDEDRRLTGRVHLRGTPWQPGEFGLVVCVWVFDGAGHVLLTRRAEGKTFAGTWENSGGAALAGESSRQAIARELREETGIRAEPEEFTYLRTDRDQSCFYDHYCLKCPMSQPVMLQPGETDGAQWVPLARVHGMIRRGMICQIIARQFLQLEPELKKRQTAQE